MADVKQDVEMIKDDARVRRTIVEQVCAHPGSTWGEIEELVNPILHPPEGGEWVYYLHWGGHFDKRMMRLARRGWLLVLLVGNSNRYHPGGQIPEGFDLRDPVQRRIAADYVEEKGNTLLADHLRRARRVNGK